MDQRSRNEIARPPLHGELLADDERWVGELPEFQSTIADPMARMELAIALSEANLQRGGGPFGAVVTDSVGRLISCGWNTVIPSHDCSAHAEINALRRACIRAESHDLRTVGEVCLYSSCAPCFMCFGAIWWSGISRLAFAASIQDAVQIGFDEGPVTPELWALLTERKSVLVEPNLGNRTRAIEVLNAYAQSGKLY